MNQPIHVDTCQCEAGTLCKVGCMQSVCLEDAENKAVLEGYEELVRRQVQTCAARAGHEVVSILEAHWLATLLPWVEHGVPVLEWSPGDVLPDGYQPCYRVLASTGKVGNSSDHDYVIPVRGN